MTEIKVRYKQRTTETTRIVTPSNRIERRQQSKRGRVGKQQNRSATKTATKQHTQRSDTEKRSVDKTAKVAVTGSKREKIHHSDTELPQRGEYSICSFESFHSSLLHLLLFSFFSLSPISFPKTPFRLRHDHLPFHPPFSSLPSSSFSKEKDRLSMSSFHLSPADPPTLLHGT